MATVPMGANFQVVSPTQLISARYDTPRQWCITVMQPVTDASGVNPWVSTFDGGAFPVVGGAIFTAPVLPVNTSLQLLLRWGAGGVAFETAFDYPFAGGVFGFTADTMDLNVGFRGVAPVYGDPLDVPVVGAFMVPGQVQDSAPLRWRELDPLGLTGFIDIGAGNTASFAVKPFTRRVRISSPDATTRYRVVFVDANNATLWEENIAIAVGPGTAVLGQSPPSSTLQVPAAAAVMTIVNNGGASVWTVEWEIGLV